MKNKKKVLGLLVCAVLLVVGSVMGTIAYLTSTDEAVNTFTVGNVQILVDEENVDKDVYDGKEPARDKQNDYKLMPGQTYTKDPRMTVLAGSDESYVRMIVKVDNLDQLKSAIPEYVNAADGVFLLQNLVTGWDAQTWQYAGFDANTSTYEFRYKETVTALTDNAILEPLFTNIVVPKEINNDNLAKLAKVVITVEGHAIQAEGFANADAAWAAFTK